MATRLGIAPQKRNRLTSTKKCPTCHMGTVDELRNGQQALQSVMAQQRLKALAKARRVKAKNAKRRASHAVS